LKNIPLRSQVEQPSNLLRQIIFDIVPEKIETLSNARSTAFDQYLTCDVRALFVCQLDIHQDDDKHFAHHHTQE